MSVIAPATVLSQPSAIISQFTWSPAQVPALVKAAENFSFTFASHADSPEESFVAATFAWQPRRPDSFLPMAFSFAPVHLSAWAETRPKGKQDESNEDDARDRSKRRHADPLATRPPGRVILDDWQFG